MSDFDPKDPVYVGDGIYAESDGYQLWIRVGSHLDPRVAALEPQVLVGLLNHAVRCGLMQPPPAPPSTG